MHFVILVFAIVVAIQAVEIMANLVDAHEFLASYSPQIFWSVCALIFASYSLVRPVNRSSIISILGTIVGALVVAYLIGAGIELLKYPQQDWKVLFMAATIFLLLPSVVVSVASFFAVAWLKRFF